MFASAESGESFPTQHLSAEPFTFNYAEYGAPGELDERSLDELRLTKGRGHDSTLDEAAPIRIPAAAGQSLVVLTSGDFRIDEDLRIDDVVECTA